MSIYITSRPSEFLERERFELADDELGRGRSAVSSLSHPTIGRQTTRFCPPGHLDRISGNDGS